ncbi:MAG: ATP-binding protein [Vulcanimicrobiota bacterium]
MQKTVLIIVCLLLCALTMSQNWGPPSQAGGVLALISFVVLEFQAAPLALGNFSPASCWAVALASLHELSLAWVLVCLACAITARTVFLPASPDGPLRDAVVDFVPAALGAWAMHALGWWGSIPVLALVAIPVPILLGHALTPHSGVSRTRASLKLEHFSMVSLGPVAGLLGQLHPGLTLLVWPSVFSLLRAATSSDELRQRRDQHIELRRARTRVDLKETLNEQTEARQGLQQRLLDARADSFALLETLAARPLTQAQALQEVLLALRQRIPQGEWNFLPGGEYGGDVSVGSRLRQVWEEGTPWIWRSGQSTQAAWRLPQIGLVFVQGPFLLSSEMQQALGVFFYYLNVWLERVRAQERLVLMLQRLQALLQGASQLSGLVSPREISELLVERAAQWTGRACAIRSGGIQVGEASGQILPFQGGELCMELKDMDASELEALRLWLVLGAAALERCQAQATLHQSSKLAAIGQLAAGVAHEINTPLGAVSVGMGMAVQYLESGRYEKAATRLQLTAKSVDQMRVIVSKMLDYSRESGSGRRLINLADIVRDSLPLVEHAFVLEKVELELPSLDQEFLVEANGGELQQVLINLLVNSRLALAGRADARVRVSLGPGTITVEDNGPGVPPENVERIFEPFFTTREVGQGVGLGLSISREILASHEGELRYRRSELGGACFEMTMAEVKE